MTVKVPKVFANSIRESGILQEYGFRNVSEFLIYCVRARLGNI